MIERILRGVFPYDEYGDDIGCSVLIVKPSMFSPETMVNIGWRTDTQGGYEVSDFGDFPEERPFLPLPQNLSVVRTADLDAANARIAALEAENAALRQAAGALQRLEEWMSVAGEGNERMYKIEAGRNWAGVLLYHNGVEILGRGEPTIAAAIDAALAQVEVAGE